MDNRGFDRAHADAGNDPTEGGVGEATMQIGTDERRMHVRAYNHWVSLLKGCDFPSIADLDPAGNADFGPHSVLLDFTAGIEDPSIRYLGRALRDECAHDQSITRLADVPARSLLSRLTHHSLQIIASRAPIGFEAEFVGTRGHNTMYRGILMPFSSDGDTIDFIYGVINWKELVGIAEQAQLTAELAAAVRSAPHVAAPATIWADGPSAAAATADAVVTPLRERVAFAREASEVAFAAAARSRCALHHALGQAYDIALAASADPSAIAALLADAGIKSEPHAPMAPIVQLLLGREYGEARLTEFAAVLTVAAAAHVPAAGLVTFLEMHPGGFKGLISGRTASRR